MNLYPPQSLISVVALCLVSAGCENAAELATAQGGNSSSLQGYWRVTEAGFKGQPWADGVGAIHLFEPNGVYTVYRGGREHTRTYDVDATKTPCELTFHFLEVQSFGIFQVNLGTLVMRMSHDTHQLTFDNSPQGDWNEFKMVKVPEEIAVREIAMLMQEPAKSPLVIRRSRTAE